MALRDIRMGKRSGPYTPVFSGGVNLDSLPTFTAAYFSVQGSLVQVFMTLNIIPTAGLLITTWDMTVPVNPRAVFASTSATGVLSCQNASTPVSDSGRVFGIAGGNLVRAACVPTTLGSGTTVALNFVYLGNP